MMAYSDVVVGPKLKKVETPTLPGRPNMAELFNWHYGTVGQRRFIGKSFWIETGKKIVRSESSWLLWVENEKKDGSDFSQISVSRKEPIIVTLCLKGYLTLWGSLHRVAISISNNVNPIHAKVGIEKATI